MYVHVIVEQTKICFQIYLNGKVLKCETIVKHLGIYMTHTNSDCEDIKRKKGEFIGRSNNFIVKYSKLCSEAQSKLFSTYCTHMYGCEVWNLNEHGINNIVISWNIVIRKIWGLPPMAHLCLLPGLSRTLNITAQIH